MKKNISYQYLVLILSLFSFNSLCLGANKDILLKRNVFFEQSKDLLATIEKVGSSSKEGLANEIVEYNSLLQQTEILLNKLQDNRFICSSISSLKLEELLHQIDGRKQKFLTHKNRFLTQDRKQAGGVVFDFMLKGILLDLSFDHLTGLRENLILHLKNILFLENYWKNEQDTTALWKNDKNDLREKLRNLFYLKERTACFVGKMDEHLLSLFKIANDPVTLNQDLFEQVGLFMDQAIFSMYSFFSENFDPDKQNYNEHFLEFCKFDFQQKTRLFCKNHINVCMAEESLRFQIRDLEMPSFLRRHWLAASATSLAVAGGGVLVYQNREYLFGGKCEDDLHKFYDEYIKKWVFEPFVRAKESIEGKFFPNAYLKENKDSLTNASDRLKDTLKDACQDLVKKGMIDSFDEQELSDLDKLSNKLYVAFDKQKKTIFDDKYKDIKDILDAFKKNMKELNEHLPNVFYLLGMISERKDGIQGDENTASSSTDGKDKNEESNEWQFTSFIKTLPRLISMGKEASANLAKLKNTRGNELDPAMAGLLGVINQFTHLIENVGDEASAFVAWVKIIEAMSCIYGIDASKRVVGMINLVEAVKRWVPIILTTITVCVAINIIYSHMVQNRIKKVSLTVAEVYRILLGYKSPSVDLYQQNLRYKDQGMMSFWLEILSEDFQALSKENRTRISRLITELQNPEYSISQRIEFIKLEWGKYLFGIPGVA